MKALFPPHGIPGCARVSPAKLIHQRVPSFTLYPIFKSPNAKPQTCKAPLLSSFFKQTEIYHNFSNVTIPWSICTLNRNLCRVVFHKCLELEFLAVLVVRDGKTWQYYFTDGVFQGALSSHQIGYITIIAQARS